MRWPRKVLAGQIVDAHRWLQWRTGLLNRLQVRLTVGGGAKREGVDCFPISLRRWTGALAGRRTLGNAHYNQPQNVVDVPQNMRQRAQSNGKLKSTSHQNVSPERLDYERERGHQQT